MNLLEYWFMNKTANMKALTDVDGWSRAAKSLTNDDLVMGTTGAAATGYGLYRGAKALKNVIKRKLAKKKPLPKVTRSGE